MLMSMTLAPPSTLLPGDLDRLFVVLFLHQAGKLSRAGHVGPFADHQEIAVGAQCQRLRAAKPQARGDVVRWWGFHSSRARHGRDMLGPVPQQPPDDVHPTVIGKLADELGHLGRAEIVLSHLVRQSRRWDGN